MEDFYERFELLSPHYQDGEEIVVAAIAKIPCKFKDLSDNIDSNLEYENTLVKFLSFKPWITSPLDCECCIPPDSKVVFRFRLLEKLF